MGLQDDERVEMARSVRMTAHVAGSEIVSRQADTLDAVDVVRHQMGHGHQSSWRWTATDLPAAEQDHEETPRWNTNSAGSSCP